MSLDLFKFLDALARKDLRAYEKLLPAEQKEVAPFVLQRWRSTASPSALVAINTFVNPYAFALGQQKDLLCGLIAACGGPPRSTWLKPPGGDRMTQRVDVLSRYLRCSRREARLVAGEYDPTDIIEMAEELGFEKAELTKLETELYGPRSAPKGGGRKAK